MFHFPILKNPFETESEKLNKVFKNLVFPELEAPTNKLIRANLAGKKCHGSFAAPTNSYEVIIFRPLYSD
jgi:hypothetical protein